ncbi:MAG: fasciclin domain-containing protein [Pseudomonadota bacterium]
MDIATMATITQIASTNGNFDILASLLTTAGLAATFDNAADGPDAFTVFAPTDAAFEALAVSLGYAGPEGDEAAVETFLVGVLTELGGGDPLPTLTTILQYHVSAGAKTLAEVGALANVETLQGGTIAPDASGDGPATLGDADPSGVDPAVVVPDVAADNGIIHGIDQVLLPLDLQGNNPTIAEIAAGNPDFSILVELLATADLVDAVADPAADLTVFAPTNAAFGALAQSLGFTGDAGDAEAVTGFLVEALTGLGGGDPLPLLTSILTYHVSPGGKTLSEVAALSEVATLDGATFAPGPDGTLIDADPDAPDPALALTDLLASNGVVHAIDGVLLPLDAPTFAVQQGGDRPDLLAGGASADNLIGGGGADILRGRRGDDVLSGGRGADAVLGGAGDDDMSGGGGADLMIGGKGDDAMSGGGRADKMHGNTGDDVMTGGAGADVLAGGRGGDELSGGAGRDLLLGGRGDDTLDGGAGRDLMRGGSGDDVFVYGEGGGRDRVADFAAGEDVLDVSSFGLADFEAFEALGAQRSRAATFDFGDGDVLTLVGVQIDELSASDVLL